MPMRKSRVAIVVCAVLFVSFLGAAAITAAGSASKNESSAAAPQTTPACNRACLQNIMDEYVAALAKHDDDGLPLASNVKFTENTAPLQIGDRPWGGVTGASSAFKFYAVD